MITSIGQILLALVWALIVLIITILFSGVGGLVYLPWLSLLVPFALCWIIVRRSNAISQKNTLTLVARIMMPLIGLWMLGVLIYLYSIAVLSYCPVRYR